MFSYLIFENDDRGNKVSCQYVNSPIMRHDNFNLPDNEVLSERTFLNIITTLSKSKGYYEKYYKLDDDHKRQNIRKINDLFYEINVKGYQRATAVVQGTKYSIFKVHNRELSFVDNYFKQYKKELELMDNYDYSLNKTKETTKKIASNPKVKQTTTTKKKRKVKRVNKFVLRRRVFAILAVILLLTSAKGISNLVSKKHSEKNAEPLSEFYQDTNNYLNENDYNVDVDNKIDDKSIENIINDYNDKIAQNGISIQEVKMYDQIFSLDAEDWTNSKKYIDCNNNYRELITKYAKMYGIDPNIAIAIACHERGYHSSEVDSGGGLGLYQIQVEGGWNWNNESITAYNFETGSNETYVITKENMRDVEQNIKAAMMIFQSCLRNCDYNFAKAIQQYNYGPTYMNKVLNDAANDLGVSVDYFDDVSHTEWINYCNYGGDPNYVKNIFKYVPSGTIIEITKKDGTVVKTIYNNLNYDFGNVISNEESKSRS